jgi:hypothetical protein
MMLLRGQWGKLQWLVAVDAPVGQAVLAATTIAVAVAVAVRALVVVEVVVRRRAKLLRKR